MTGTGGTAMVGRDAEISLVNTLVAAVADGRGGMLLVLGEAGIGKSRLLAEAVRDAREAGLLVLSGRAVEGGGAYRPLAEALAGPLRTDPSLGGDALLPYRAALGRMLPGWAAGTQPPAGLDSALVLGEGLVRLLRALAGTRGCLLVLDDLHWADADTLAVLEYLAGAVRDCGVLIIGSARDDERPARRLDRLTAHPETRRVRLRRLDDAGVLELAERRSDGVLPDDVRRLVLAKSDGLPFLVEELVAGGLAASAVPPTFAGMVDERLAALTPERRRVLEAAAVLGDEPDWMLLRTVTGATEATVLAALRAARPRLVTDAGDTLRWRHALTRDAVLATVTPPERAVFARRSAEALLSRGGPDDHVRAAELLAAARDRDRAATIFLRLAREDLDRGAFRDAAALLERAEATAAPEPAVAVERVRLLTSIGEADAALAEGTKILDRTTGEDHARLCLRLADAAITLRRCDEADRLLRRAGRPDDPYTLTLAAESAFRRGDLPEAARLAETAVEAAEAAGAVDACCHALLTLGRCGLRQDAEAVRPVYERAAQLAAEHGLRPWRVAALIGLSTVDMHSRPFPPVLAEARALAVETGCLTGVLGSSLLHVEGVLVVDGPIAAEARARQVAAEAGRLRLPVLQALAELYAAHGRAADGDEPGARALLTAAGGRTGAPIEVTALAPAVLGLRCLLDHDLEGAAGLFDQSMRRLIGRQEAAPVPQWGLWALLRTVTADRGDEARAEARHSYAAQRSVNRGVLLYADAVAAGRAGRAHEAVDLLAAGDATLAEQHWWRRLCRTVVMEAAIGDGWGDPVAVLRTDLAALEETGENRLARTCRDLLRRAGAPTRRGRGLAPVPGPLRAAGVTSREVDVLGLLAEGLTNRQIAGRLFLSPRTVDTHVANLLAKTGAADRTQLRAHWSERTIAAR